MKRKRLWTHTSEGNELPKQILWFTENVDVSPIVKDWFVSTRMMILKKPDKGKLQTKNKAFIFG
jgi:hypothetical protein